MRKMLLIASLFTFVSQGVEASQYNPSGLACYGSSETRQKLIEPTILTMGEGQGHVNKLLDGSISVLLPESKTFFSLGKETVNKVPALSEFFQANKRSVGINNAMVAVLNLAVLEIGFFKDNKFAAVMNTAIILKSSGS